MLTANQINIAVGSFEGAPRATATKLPLAVAVRLANIAAGVVVGKVGTATVTSEELLESFRQAQSP